jgi:large subunit ribosomal protein L19
MKASRITKETVLDLGIKDRGFPTFKVGDTIEVSQVVKDGDKERIQLFEGDVIAMHNNGIASTFTVRRIGANGVGVERILPYYSKNISEIKLVKHGQVRRAKLNYLRERVGRAARIKEQMANKETTAQSTN